VDALDCPAGTTREVWLEGVSFALRLARQVFRNEDGSEGVRYLVASDTTMTFERMTDLYHKRWKVEEYHNRAAKQNAGAAKSPTRTEATQSRHLLCMPPCLRQARAPQAE
jgi:hypothetical protein